MKVAKQDGPKQENSGEKLSVLKAFVQARCHSFPAMPWQLFISRGQKWVMVSKEMQINIV